jgi:hypothetical protein
LNGKIAEYFYSELLRENKNSWGQPTLDME